MTELQYATDLAVLRFEGVDAARFLQGYLTCNTALLEPEAWQATTLCNLQGRVIISGWAQGGANAVDLLVHTSLAAATLEFLAPYQRFSRTKSKALEAVTVSATATAVTPIQIDFQINEPGQSRFLARDRFLSILNTRRHVVVTAQTSAEFLPQALGLVDAGAVAFDKGCYLGQEVVARAEHRGNVKKNLVLVLADKPLDGQLMDINNTRTGKVVQLATHSALIVANRELDPSAIYRLGETSVTLSRD
jgi:tRNA-modifying protein YgfZ